MMARSAVWSACLVALSAMILAGCEVRRDDAREAEPAPAPTLAETALSAENEPGEDEAPPDPATLTPLPLALLVGFPEGGTQLDADGQRTLQMLMESRQLAQGWPIVLRGHTDSGGSDSGNLIASRRRAEEVAGWLVDHGVAQERIEIIAFGEHLPIAPNARNDGTPSESGRARNRRVEIWVGAPDTEADEDTQWLAWPDSAEQLTNSGA